jgi:tetratricopeptide (TPR) repeat protein
MRQRGVSLSKQGKEEEALSWYGKALAANPQDFAAMRNMGVSLSKQGKMTEAMVWYDKALAANPQDYDAMRQRGVSLSKQGKEAEAMVWYDKALAAKPDDAHCYRCYAVSKAKSGDMAGALEMIKKALTLKPDDKEFQGVLQYIASSMGVDSSTVLDDIAPTIDLEKPGIDALRGLVRQTREKIQPRIDDYKEKMKTAEDRLRKFLGKESNIQPDRSLLLTLRKWNSYTPTIPSGNDERYVGGGYVLYHNGKAVVIDPGHNFIENFDQAGGRVCDIDAIVMTHAHSDHTNDFESLLTLLYEYNAEHHLKAGMADYKQVDVYLNVGAMKKFSGLVDLRGSDYIRNVVVMSPHTEYVLSNGIRLCPLPAYHDELVTKRYAVGLHLRVPVGDGTSRTLLFTADTGLFPQTKKKVDGGKEKTVADVDGKEIHERYRDCVKDVDVLIPHLGSIKPEEIEAEIDTRWDEIFYPNHLGILGTIRLITSVSPRLVFVSEFGEELRGFRSELMTIMQEVVTKFRAGKGHDIRVLPADTPLIYDIKKDEIYCVLSEDFCTAAKMCFKEVGDSFFYYTEEKKDKLSRLPGMCEIFLTNRKNRFKLYFQE